MLYWGYSGFWKAEPKVSENIAIFIKDSKLATDMAIPDT